MANQIGDTIDWTPRQPRGRRRGMRYIVLLVLALLFSAGTAVSYYVEALWFESLGYGAVFWRMLNFQSAVLVSFVAATFALLYGSFLALRPPILTELAAGGVILIGGRPVQLPVEPVLRFIALVVSLGIALITGLSMMDAWPTLALWWYGRDAAFASAAVGADPIFGRPIPFYLFVLPVWQLLLGWATTIAVLVCAMALFFHVASTGTRALQGRQGFGSRTTGRGLAMAWACLLLVFAARTYVGRYDRLFDVHTIFSGVTYTNAHITLTGALIVSMALALGAVVAAVAAVARLRLRWLVAAIVPAIACAIVTAVVAWYVNSFIVKPNELVRESPFIAHNIALTRQAYGLDRVSQRPFPAETTVEAADPENNQATLQNIRLWDWRALQDTLRQIQEIRTYYDFPDIDIDRYVIDGTLRQVMLATRELSVAKLPESSRNWINEKLVYTHGYGITMNPVNGFTAEGLPLLILGNMPVRSTVPSLQVTRPEVYFGELTTTDVYVKTRQKEFNYPQGQTNNLNSYEGSGGIAVGGLFRRLLIAIDRGDLAKLPFSDDVTASSRLLMRRSLKARITALAPFLTFDPDPYVVIRKDGGLSWIIDGFTTSTTFPYSQPYQIEQRRINYLRNSVKAVVDAYDGTTTFYVFDNADPMIAAYRAVFPTLFKDASAMPEDLRQHVRYPELLLQVQAEVYALYHMTDPEVFYNREDLWAMATDIAGGEQPQQNARPMEPNFVLMTLPGEAKPEFVEIVAFTPANRNNLIGWIAGRSDDPHYGNVIVYDFPKTRLVDGPLQIEARIDQNPQLSGQLSLWNQQGSHVRRGALLVIPIGRALLYAEPIYLQAERSPMPELRLVVLALQDRLAYGPTFETALAALFGDGASTLTGPAPATRPATPAQGTPAPGGGAQPPAAPDVDALIADAAKDLAEYQRLTAEGKLGEAGQKLDHLKRTLEELNRRRK